MLRKVGLGLIAATATLVAQMPAATASDGLICDWYAISICSRSYNEAEDGANRFGGRVVRTDNIDNFRSGFWCSVVRSQSKSGARQTMSRMKRRGARSAYIKEGCTDY
ncbi:MAG: hypothetical protein AAFR23_10180 [Pseudomonadota bacterium]